MATKKAAPAAKPATKTGRTVAEASGAAAGSKSDQMRALFSQGMSVADVAKATDSHYSFAHGVMRRMVASGELTGNATKARESKAAAAPAKATRTTKATATAAPVKQTAAQRQAAKKQAGRPTAARRTANRKGSTPEA